LFIQDISGNTITSPNHNLDEGMYVKFDNLGSVIITPNITGIDTYLVSNVTTNTFDIDGTASGTYIGGGTIKVCNKINIRTKNFSPFANMATDTQISYIQLLLNRTTQGEVTLNIFERSDYNNPIPPITGSSVMRTYPDALDGFAVNQDQIWHTTYRNMITSSFQVQITLSDEQMRDDLIREADFTMHALLFAAQPAGRLRK